MKQEEKSMLYNKKIGEGKDNYEADYEIARDEYFINKTKEDYRELKRRVKELEKENSLLRKSINKNIISNAVEIDKKSNKKIKETKKTSLKTATVRDLNRILMILDSNKRVGLSELTKSCILEPKIINSGLSFLAKINLVKIKKQGRKTLIEKK